MKQLLYLWAFLYGSAATPSMAQETIVHYLSGTDKDQTVAWDFMVSHGRNSNRWGTIQVPSCWEHQGYGTFNYYEDRQNPEEKGWYRHRFTSDASWKGKTVFLVFEGVMTDTEVKVDGEAVGAVHQGGFYQFRYNITKKIKPGKEQLLEVTVRKRSANASVNRAERQADFWLFGGIYRPVYLEIVPPSFVERVAIDAKADGQFGIRVFTQHTKPNHQIELEIQDLDGRVVGPPVRLAAKDSMFLQHRFAGVRPWNPEQPQLYQAVITLKAGDRTVHALKKRFGFRTVAFRAGDGFYVNDTKVIFKGVNRHSQWPESGRTLSRSVHETDIRLMKEMNMNAVRMSHYPPDQEFLDLCDSLGLFVIDELTGWQKAYDTTVGRKLVRELVLRDVNHPSIVIWANGNEGGWNRALDGDFAWYDPQHRFVMHPWEKFNGTETKHYPDFNFVTNAVLYGSEVYYPTEFMHGLFDGGHGAGLEDFWNEMQKHRGFSGGFLWALHDEGVKRDDLGGRIDVAGNAAPDGIVGPYREKEASFYTIKEIWSPVGVDLKVLPKAFTGKIPVANRYLYTNLSAIRFEWKTVSFTKPHEGVQGEKIMQQGKVSGINMAPGEQGFINMGHSGVLAGDALYLSAFDAGNNLLCTWSWAIGEPSAMVQKEPASAKANLAVTQQDSLLMVECDQVRYIFDTATGFLRQVMAGGKTIPFGGGPDWAGQQFKLSEFRHYQSGDVYIVQPEYGESRYWVKWLFKPGKLPKLEYSYQQKGVADYMGITFQYPEPLVTGMQWMGRGPYRVWKNRMKGQQFGVWKKKYNNTITGESWNYPEFKGWHAEMWWVKLETREHSFVVYTDRPNIFLQMMAPEKPKGATNNNTSPPFPKATIGFMNAISPIGTKFQAAELLGPQSQKNIQMNYGSITGALYFDFR